MWRLNTIVIVKHTAQRLLHNENSTNINCNDNDIVGGGDDNDNDDSI